ncbi:MAG: hypothetical protein KC422_25290 [Trueperaceae bacterium]|nr:hypothetical protein [Trueperaceae bacterium]
MKYLFDLPPVALKVTLLDYLNRALKAKDIIKFKIAESNIIGAFDCKENFPQLWLARPRAQPMLQEVQEVLHLTELDFTNIVKIEKAGTLWFLVACEN